MSEPEKGHDAQVAARIGEMAARVYGVPQDAFGIQTAEDCARMLGVLSRIVVEPADEPFIPAPDESPSGKDAV